MKVVRFVQRGLVLGGIPLLAAACQPAALMAVAPASALTASTPAAAATTYPEWQGWLAPKVTPAQYLQRQTAGESFLIIDSRPSAPYNAEHIQGSLNVPDAQLATLQATLPRDKQLLVYCTCSDEGLSLTEAGELHDNYGFGQLQVILGGLAAWKAAGLPTAGTNLAPAASASPAS